MNTEKNLVSVIMSNFNTPEEYLRSAIESILNQTYKNFELIIIDDCSTDNSLSIIESYSDDRIYIIRNEINLGITKSLNRGLAVAKGEFVARMDADDIAIETRFEKQVSFLKSHPDHIVCGTGVELIGDWERIHNNKFICRKIPAKDEYRIHLLFGNYPNMVHPTVMFNHKLLLNHNITYNENYPLAQDYRMWVSCSEVGECANINEMLLNYRVHNKAVSSEKKDLQKNIAIQIMQEQLNQLHLELTEETTKFHKDFLFARKEYSVDCKKWIKILLRNNKKYNIYNQKLFRKILWKKWTEITYFGIAKEKKAFNILKMILNIPIIYIPYLFKIKKSRKHPTFGKNQNCMTL